MEYVVAVSGGVDSVVLLDQLSQTDSHLIVAHFDHGIRADSAADARFVAALAAQYGLEYVSERAELGTEASEEQARTARYEFLLCVARDHQATLATAHHRDDLVETIALNLHRGTGWRGLAVLARPEVKRPLIGMTKMEIYQYALDHRLEWAEDATNHDLRYTRNQLRARLQHTMVDATQLAQLRERQVTVGKLINEEARQFVGQSGTLNRHFLTQIDQPSAYEVLRAACLQVSTVVPPRPHLSRALLAAKTARSGTIHQLGSGLVLVCNRQTVSIKQASDLV